MDAASHRASVAAGTLAPLTPLTPLARALRAAEDIVSVVSVAFGPWGRGVLIRGAAGDLTITRAAMDILEAAFPPGEDTTPEHVVLLQNARALRQRTGDGVKSYLLTTAALLHQLQGLQRRGAVLAGVHADLAGASSRLSAMTPRPTSYDPVEVSAASVAESILATRFTSDVAAAALPSVATLLQDADDLRAHLGVLCRRRHAAGRSVADSFVRDGVVVDGMLRFVAEGCAERRRVMVLAGDERDDAVDVQAAAAAVLVDEAVDATRTLVVTAAVLGDASLLALRMRGAAALHGLTPEDERFILEWTLGAGEAGAEVEVRAEPQQGAVWLGLPGVRQLQLHAPTQQLADQLASAVRDALQLLTFTKSVAVPGECPLGPGGGCLERELHRALGGAPLGREELLRWHQARGEPRTRPHVVESVLPAFDGLDADVRKAVAEAAAAVPRALPSAAGRSPPLEPMALRLAVMQHSMATVGTLLSVDRVLAAKRTAD